jgi:hypothetical protein
MSQTLAVHSAGKQALIVRGAMRLFAGQAASGGTTVSGLRRHAFADPHDYIGTAPLGSTEEDATWKIVRQTVALDGTATVGTAINVSWTGRAGHTYT